MIDEKQVRRVCRAMRIEPEIDCPDACFYKAKVDRRIENGECIDWHGGTCPKAPHIYSTGPALLEALEEKLLNHPRVERYEMVCNRNCIGIRLLLWDEKLKIVGFLPHWLGKWPATETRRIPDEVLYHRWFVAEIENGDVQKAKLASTLKACEAAFCGVEIKDNV